MSSALAGERVPRNRGLLGANRGAVGAAAALAGAAWLALLWAHRGAGRGHAAAALEVGSGLGLWLAMVAAMMLPAVAPWLAAVETLAPAHRGARPTFPPALAFAGGYLAAWIPYAAVGALGQWLLQPVLSRPGLSALGALPLLLAGAYQLSPLKAACLRHCRSPLGFLLARWRDGPMHAFELGVRHGVVCLGCCWALMTICLAVGVTDVIWMGALALVIWLEQLAPAGPRLGHAAGWGLLCWGAWLLVGRGV